MKVFKDFNEMIHHLRGKVEEIIPKEYEPSEKPEGSSVEEEAKAVEEAPKKKRKKKEK